MDDTGLTRIKNPRQVKDIDSKKQVLNMANTEITKSSDPHEFFDKYNEEKKKQSEISSVPEYLLR